MTNQTQRPETIKNSIDRPNLVYFQPKYAETLPEFVLSHQREHVKCLSAFFRVTVINEDCDYQQICDEYEPDLAVFETGINILTCRTPRIRNVRTCQRIPKVGLINADAWCETRSGTLSELEHWGIETVFSIAITAAEHTPELADNIFVWPNCVDSDVYKDYQEHKLIPILLSGANAALYPWRQRVHELLAARYPSLSCPHPGYLARPAAGSSMHGELYARTLNASWIAPVCGTVAKELVRKHFEIPACKTLMVSEESPGLLAAGFIDMQNCVFADDRNVLDKVAYLFEHPDELAAIASTGHDLVHRRHTMKQRDQLFQWYMLRQSLQANQKIIQPSAFGPLTVVSCSSGLNSNHIISNGAHLSLLRQGDDRLLAGRYEEAEAAYVGCLGYMRRLPEALLKRAVCNLYRGNASLATAMIFELVQYSLDEYKAPDPDPVEWACYILALLGQGKVKEASKRAREFPVLCHIELDRVRWAAQALQGDIRGACLMPGDATTKSRPSIHRFATRTMEEWIAEVCKMLVACRQPRLATKLAELFASTVRVKQDRRLESIGDASEFVGKKSEWHGNASEMSLASNNKFSFVPFRCRLAHYKLRRKIRIIHEHLVRSIESKYEGLLRSAASRTQPAEEYRHAIAELIWKEKLNTALVVGNQSQKSSAALVVSAIESRSSSVEVNVRAALKNSDRLGGSSVWRFVPCTPGLTPGGVDGEDSETNTSERESDLGNDVDMLLVGGSKPRVALGDLKEIIRAARFVALENTSSVYGRELLSYLLSSTNHVLIMWKQGVNDSYAIFRNEIVDRPRSRQVLSIASTTTKSDLCAQIESESERTRQ